MIGYNFRLGEIECAIDRTIEETEGFVQTRQRAALKITKGLEKLEGLLLPHTEEFNTHAYYMYPMVLDIERINVKRELIKKLKS